MITIVENDIGNVASIINMLKKIGVESVLTSDPVKLSKASKLILPGVGAFNSGMKSIDKIGVREVLLEQVKEKKIPVLGICLGMQLMFEGSQEGEGPGLGWLKGSLDRFKEDEIEGLKIPHMGWSKVKEVKESKLLRGIDEARFYFVHSYRLALENSCVVGSATYGKEFGAIVENDNIYGVQFHPEKSHHFGMKLLKNFSELN